MTQQAPTVTLSAQRFRTDRRGGPGPGDRVHSQGQELCRRLADVQVRVGARLEEAARRAGGMTLTEVLVLEHLRDTPVGHSDGVTAIAGAAGITKSGATRLVARHVRAGRLVRTRDVVDGRRRHVVITDSGRAALSATLLDLTTCMSDLLQDREVRASLAAAAHGTGQVARLLRADGLLP